MNISSIKSEKSWKYYNSAKKMARRWPECYFGGDLLYEDISIGSVQAFSQLHFFLGLVENKGFENVWTHYPRLSEVKITNSVHWHSRIYAFIPYLKKQIGLPNSELDIILLGGERHLKDGLGLIKHLNSVFKIAVLGKYSPQFGKVLNSNQILNVQINSGLLTSRYFERVLLLLHFLTMNWKLKSRKCFLVNPLWNERLSYLKYIAFPEIASLIKTAKKIYKDTMPKAVVTFSSNDTFGASFSLTAKKLKIPVIEIQHGMLSWGVVERDFENCDYYFVWGEIPKRFFPKKAIVVGCPMLFEKVKKNKGKKIILILLNPPYGATYIFRLRNNKQVLKELFDSLGELSKEYEIRIRLHPSFPDEELPEMKSAIGNAKLVLDKSPDFINSIAQADTVISQPTTAALIAAYFNKKLLIFDNSVLFTNLSDPLVKSGSAVVVPLNELRYIKRYIERLSYPNIRKDQAKKQKAFFKKYIRCLGHKSFQEIEKQLKIIISQNR